MRPEELERAACRGMGPDLFIVNPRSERQVEQAKAVCRGCVVRLACLEEALNTPEGWVPTGVWGGTIDQERLILRQARQAS